MQAPVTKVFIIKREYAQALFTIRYNDAQSVIAFRNHGVAKSIANLNNMHKKQQQPMKIESTRLDVLWRRCSQNALRLIIFNDKGDYEVLEKYPLSTDDMQFYFENNARYFSIQSNITPFDHDCASP